MAILQFLENDNNSAEKLNKSVIGETKTGAPSFKNFPLRLLITVLFDGFILFKSFKTVSCVVGSSQKFIPLKFKVL